MNPAYSVIFFSTATGAGYGLLIPLALLAGAGLIPPRFGFGLATFSVAFLLVTGGLLASTVHLGHPERAWRALTQWRTSWLSREGVAALLAYVPLTAYAFGWVVLGANDGAWAWIGLAGAALAVMTIICTAMIYASLKPVPRWHNGWVVPVYLAMALATGGLILNLLLQLFGLHAPWMAWQTAGTIVAAWAIRLAYWRHIDAASQPGTAGTATGLGHLGEVRQLESPHTSENFVMKEMGYRIARRHAHRLRRIAVSAGGAVPLALLAAVPAVPATPGSLLLVMSVVAAATGVLVERWLFFAEARHVVTLYYGDPPLRRFRPPHPPGSARQATAGSRPIQSSGS
ncbi:MAG TPA: DmsC/YnfH family molybdoenzyme membrane anchor subunit [Gammaproteobacteria bacterium]|nr:DmsC/YnfH family molybdoenzyme membrane anchor subunit [Gammaproteobacteria bacterium]